MYIYMLTPPTCTPEVAVSKENKALNVMALIQKHSLIYQWVHPMTTQWMCALMYDYIHECVHLHLHGYRYWYVYILSNISIDVSIGISMEFCIAIYICDTYISMVYQLYNIDILYMYTYIYIYTYAGMCTLILQWVYALISGWYIHCYVDEYVHS